MINRIVDVFVGKEVKGHRLKPMPQGAKLADDSRRSEKKGTMYRAPTGNGRSAVAKNARNPSDLRLNMLRHYKGQEETGARKGFRSC
jgi:hypothetical protein